MGNIADLTVGVRGDISKLPADLATGESKLARFAKQAETHANAAGAGLAKGMAGTGSEAAEGWTDAVETGVRANRGRLGAAFKAVVVGAVTAAAVAGGAALGSALTTDAANDKLAAQLGLTEKQAAVSGKVAGSLFAAAYGESAQEVNTALGAVVTSVRGMGSASERTLTRVTAKALDFAAAFEVDVKRGVQVAGQLVGTGLAKNATTAFDLITAASQRVPANLREDILDAADEYGQFFATLGFDGEQAFAMLVDGSAKGMYGIDKIGDAVKEFTIRSTDMSKASTDAYKAIGLNAGTMANDILAGGDKAQTATRKIVDGLLELPRGAEQANAAIALFGTPLEDLNTSEIPAFLKALRGGSKSMEGFGGASKRMGETLHDNAATKIEAFKRSVSTTFVNLVGGKAIPVVENLADKLSAGLGPALSSTAGFFREHETVAKILVGTIVALTVLTAAHSAVMAVAAAGGLAKWLLQTKLISAATKVWAAVQWAMNAALLANPIVLVVAGLVALGVALVVAYKKSETFRNIVNGAFSAVVGGAKNAYNWVKSNWPLLLAILTGPFGIAVALVVKHWDKITAGGRRALGWVKSNWPTIVAVLAGPFGIAALAVIKNWDKITGAGKRAVAYVQSIPGKVKSKLGDLGSLLVSAGEDLLMGMVRGVTNKVSALKDAVGNAVSGAVDWGKKKLGIKSPSRVFMKIGHQSMDGLIVGVDQRAPGVRDAVGRAMGLMRKTAKRGRREDRTLLTPAGRVMMRGLLRGMRDGEAGLDAYLARITKSIEKGVDDKKISKKAGAAMKATVKAVDRQLSALARRYDRHANKLKQLVDDRESMVASIAGGITGELDLGSLITTSEPNQYGFGGGQSKVTLSSVAQAVSGLASRALGFARRLNALRKAGLPMGLILEVAGLGTVQGSAVADALLSGSKTQIKKLSKDYKAIDTYSKSAGAIVAGGFYDTGIAAQQGILRGLLKDDGIRKGAKQLATKLTKEVRRSLGIKSPSRVMADQVGAPMAQGVAVGYLSAADAAARAMSARTAGMITAPAADSPSTGFTDPAILQWLVAALVEALKQLQVQVDVGLDRRTQARIVQTGTAALDEKR